MTTHHRENSAAQFPRLVHPLRAVAAILLGNALYFALLIPRVPPWLRHRPFHADAGLLFDAALCIALYWLMGLLGR